MFINSVCEIFNPRTNHHYYTSNLSSKWLIEFSLFVVFNKIDYKVLLQISVRKENLPFNRLKYNCFWCFLVDSGNFAWIYTRWYIQNWKVYTSKLVIFEKIINCVHQDGIFLSDALSLSYSLQIMLLILQLAV